MFTQDGQISLQVLVNDLPLQEYPYQGERFIEGLIGRNFKLRIGKTQLDRRVEAVLSVDGLSIKTGELAKKSVRGYVLGSGEASMDIPGWRLSDEEVAAFIFASLPEAYASRMGKPANIGVIGATFFFELLPKQAAEPKQMLYEPPASQGSSSPAFPAFSAPMVSSPAMIPPPSPPRRARGFSLGRSAPAASPQETPKTGSSPSPAAPGVGTGFGSRQAYHVVTVQFERDLTTEQTLVLRYDTRANLEARGIRLGGEYDRVLKADPFPGDSGCTQPPGWSGQ